MRPHILDPTAGETARAARAHPEVTVSSRFSFSSNTQADSAIAGCQVTILVRSSWS